jgi:hypothetical protein
MPQRYGTSGAGGPAKLYSISSVSGTNCFIAVSKRLLGRSLQQVCVQVG